jgi:hypothetical protein
MFGRRKVPFGAPPGGPPVPPSGKEPFPIDKMDRALDGAIRLFTRALDDAGVDCGDLAIRGEVPPNVTQALTECITYRGEDDGSLTYLALGLTSDFKAFIYPPHCRLFLIINSTGICEDPHAEGILKSLAPAQLPAPLVDAHLMRRWIRYILPVGDALAGREGPGALDRIRQMMVDDLAGVLDRVPLELAARVDLKSALAEWAGGLPAALGRPLTEEVERMNGLPMTPFIADLLTDYLTKLQMRGISESHRA